MKPDFSTPIDRRNSDSIKWNFFDEDVLPLWVADMDFPAPPEVLETLTERINHRIWSRSCAILHFCCQGICQSWRFGFDPNTGLSPFFPCS